MIGNRKLRRKERVEGFIRKDIVLTAISVLHEQGIERFTMDIVAEKAGMAKGTMYLYFKSKRDLLNAVLDHVYDPLQERLCAVINGESSPIEKLEMYIRECLSHTEENAFLLIQLRTALFATMDRRISDKSSWYWTLAEMIGDVLAQAEELHLIRKMNHVRTATLFIDTVNSLMSHRILSDVKGSADQDVQDVLDIFLDGLRPRRT